LARYDPGMGLVNRDYIVARHSATKHAAALVELLRDAAPRTARPPDAPLRELARLVRLYHRADAQAFALHAHHELLTARARELERGLGVAGARADAEHAAAEAARRALAELKATRRWRALERALRPLDRARERRGSRS
ncbi:MAG TPA: hypothetical protein VE972_10895, partial [Conexibacter sp.]|nr:hypothetical protein [Conexibacter sp.]